MDLIPDFLSVPGLLDGMVLVLLGKVRADCRARAQVIAWARKKAELAFDEPASLAVTG